MRNYRVVFSPKMIQFESINELDNKNKCLLQTEDFMDDFNGSSGK